MRDFVPEYMQTLGTVVYTMNQRVQKFEFLLSSFIVSRAN